jgi:NADPH:quinone reductase-like Zn-dependent oxidoreductase
MQVIVQHRYGSADELEPADRPCPAPGEREVLVRVASAGVDRGAWHLMTGRPYLVRVAGFGLRAPKVAIPGSNFSGVVETVGAAVTTVQTGDAVYGTGSGSFAEFIVAPEDSLAPKPDGLTFPEAAVLPYAGSVALQALNEQAAAQPGAHVLVIGASGAVGSIAVQLAKALPAEVTGVCSSRRFDLARGLGADHVIDYHDDWIDRVTTEYDVILETAGNYPVRKLRRHLRENGTLVIIGGEGGDPLTGGSYRQLIANVWSPFVSQRLRAFIAKERAADLLTLNDFVDRGLLRPIVSEWYPLAEAAQAVRRLESGRPHGRVAIDVWQPSDQPVGAGQNADSRSTG